MIYESDHFAAYSSAFLSLRLLIDALAFGSQASNFPKARADLRQMIHTKETRKMMTE